MRASIIRMNAAAAAYQSLDCGEADTVVVVGTVVVWVMDSRRATVVFVVTLNVAVHAEELMTNGVMGCHVPFEIRYGAMLFEGMLQS